MKRFKQHNITALGAFAVGFFFVLATMHADASASLFGRALSLGDLTQQLQTPEAVARYMWRHFSYEKDQRQFGKSEHWQSPDELMQNKKGDCEDMALFAQAILKANGISAFLLNVYGNGYAHTVTVFKEDGKFNVIDGTKVRRYEATTLQELSEKIHPNWKAGAIVGYSKEKARGTILKSFAKKMQAHQTLAAFA